LERADNRIRVGGLKIQEEGACVVSSFPRGENRLGPDVCAPLALNRVNLTFLIHVAGDRAAFCTASEAGETALALVKSKCSPEAAAQLQAGTAILSIYPHDKRPEIIGTFIRSLARAHLVLHGLASSPSAISAVLSARRKRGAVRELFEHFQFSGFHSPQDFFAAQPPPEEYLQKVVAAYQEKVIKVYWIVPQPDLDLWGMIVPTADVLAGFANALLELAELGLTIPFLVAIPGLEGEEFLLSFSTLRRQPAPEPGSEVRRLLKRHLPEINPMRLVPVAGIFLHGPHFGDRYGIVSVMLPSLEKAGVTLLALSCTISSISLIIRQQELPAALLVLRDVFEAPVEAR
jgi:hypothetical protein